MRTVTRSTGLACFAALASVGTAVTLGGSGCSSSDTFIAAVDAGTDAAVDAANTSSVSSCTDGTKNGDETDVDCGGSCHSCTSTKACATNDDCKSGFCNAKVCRDVSCNDGAKDGSESDVDCGGSCLPCADAKACDRAADCSDAVCFKSKCSAPSCSDGVKNGSESDIDCGGSCASCVSSLRCNTTADCAPLECTSGRCSAATCTDGQQDGDELGTDCGGSCATGCFNGTTCNASSDCLSGACSASVCVAAPVPTITTIDPANASTGGGTVVTITGANFQAGASVSFNNVVASSVNVISSSRIEVSVPTCIGCYGKASVVVSEAAGAVTNSDTTSPFAYAPSRIAFGTTIYAAPAGNAVSRVATGDFNADGYADVAVTAGNRALVYLTNSAGVLGNPSTRNAATGFSGLVIGDINGDHFTDAIASTAGQSTFGYLLGTNTGTVGNDTLQTTSAVANAVAATDVDGDGKLDTLIAEQSGFLGVYVNQGGAAPTFVRGLSQAVGAAPNDLALADFDNDATLDAVTSSPTGNNVSVLLGTGVLTGTGAFQPAVNATVVNAPRSLAAADFDNDGDMDIAAANGAGGLSILLGNGDGTMQPHVDLTIPVSATTRIVAADVDADGNVDIVVGTATGVSVLFGGGDGTFTRQQSFTLTHSIGAVAVADLNHDGLLDIVAAESDAAGPLTVMLNVSQ